MIRTSSLCGEQNGLAEMFVVVPEGLWRPVWRYFEDRRQSACRRGNRPGSECDPAPVSLRSELGLKRSASGQDFPWQPMGSGVWSVVELIPCGSHDPSASLSCLATTIAA